MSLFTGQGTATSSGSIVVQRPMPALHGVSGHLTFSSGTTTDGSSAELKVGTVHIHRYGKGGSISVTVGTGNTVAGGVVTHYCG